MKGKFIKIMTARMRKIDVLGMLIKMTPPPLEDRLLAFPGNGRVFAPNARLPISFQLEFGTEMTPMGLQCIYYVGPRHISITCNGKEILSETTAPEVITLETTVKAFDIAFNYVPFGKADRSIDLEGRKTLDVNLITRKARELTSRKRTPVAQIESIFNYVHALPLVRRGKSSFPYDSDEVIRRGKAKKCVDKAQLFVDLCKAVGIPARFVSGLYFFDEHKSDWHAWAAYSDQGKFQFVDPTLGHSAERFPSQNYFYNQSAFVRITGDGGYQVRWKDEEKPNTRLRLGNFFVPFVTDHEDQLRTSSYRTVKL